MVFHVDGHISLVRAIKISDETTFNEKQKCCPEVFACNNSFSAFGINVALNLKKQTFFDAES